MRATLLFVFAISILTAVAFGLLARGSDSTPAEAAGTGAIGSADAPSLGAGLPDLIVTSIVSNQPPLNCHEPMGIRVTVKNQGDASAPNSILALTSGGGGPEPVDVPALTPGQSASVVSYNVGMPTDDYTATADALDFIEESDETNNTLEVQDLTIGTLPTCTPTPTITPTFTPTFTPTPTGFSGQDTDGDGWLGYVDNCPFTYNPGQENNDGNFIDHSPPYSSSVDDGTNALSDTQGDVCDDDDDNDALADTDENEVPCPSPTPGPGPTPGPCGPPPCTMQGFYETDRWVRDTDGDRYLDGVECTLGTNPIDAGSKPLITQCGPAGDADGDKLSDRIETCLYGTDPNDTDTDNDLGTDGGSDGCEAASLNPDRIINVADRGMVALAVGNPVYRHYNSDINKDGAWNVGDVGIVMLLFGQCPNGPALPDLSILSMKIELETGSSCAYTSTTLGVRVSVRNTGGGAAGFAVTTNGATLTLPGLAGQAVASLWFTGHTQNSTAFADSGFVIVESDENNNGLSQFLPIPTLPPTCTPTATATP